VHLAHNATLPSNPGFLGRKMVRVDKRRGLASAYSIKQHSARQSPALFYWRKPMSLRDLGLLVTLGAIWGASYLFLRVATPVLGAFVLIDLRVLIAAFALLLYAWTLHRSPRLRTHWKPLLVLGAVNAALPFTLIANATVYLNASMAAILNATTPMFTALVAAVWVREPLNWRKAAGLALGLAGVVVLVGWNPLGLNRSVAFGVAGSLAGALCYSIGGVYTKARFRGVPTLDLAIGQQFAAGVWLTPFALGAWRPQPLTMAVIVSLLALALLCTAFSYLIYFDLIARVGPTNTLSVTFLVPVFATIWGVLFLNEPLRPGLVVGLVIILTGVFLVTGGASNVARRAYGRR
jgi:drug/metabolite transporter (DMT)-like permease